MIRETNQNTDNIINLDGPDGNAFALMGILSSSFKKSGLDPSSAIDEMMSGDYQNLLKVFDRYCGNTFTLVTRDKKLIKALKASKELSLQDQLREIMEAE